MSVQTYGKTISWFTVSALITNIQNNSNILRFVNKGNKKALSKICNSKGFCASNFHHFMLYVVPGGRLLHNAKRFKISCACFCSKIVKLKPFHIYCLLLGFAKDIQAVKLFKF